MRPFSIFVSGLLLAPPLAADGIACRESTITVWNAEDRTRTICEAASKAIEQLSSCNLIVSQKITIEIIDTLPRNCHGLYLCDDKVIQLLPLENYMEYLSKNPESPFSHLEPEVFFDSVLRHELAHAALDGTPCPFDVCPVTREFVAYSMQTWFLSDTDRAPFDQAYLNSDKPMTRDDISALALMMVPNTFIKNAYVYLSQRNDPCEFIAEIVRGEVVLDLAYR